MRAVLAQTRVELTLTLRRGESVLLALGIPVLLLVFFSTVDVGFIEHGDRVDFVAPGVLALAVMSTAMVGLGIATGFERQYLVLKRLALKRPTAGCADRTGPASPRNPRQSCRRRSPTRVSDQHGPVGPLHSSRHLDRFKEPV